MRLIDVVRQECVVTGLEIADKQAALREVARVAKQSPILDNVDEAVILEGLEEREALGSTGFGKGIALPHCRIEGVKEFVVGLLTVKDGVEFESMDEAPVHLIAFIIAPCHESNDHIRVLSAISKVLTVPGVIEELIAAPSKEALLDGFLRHTETADESDDDEHRSLIHVFVQEEDLFRELLQVFAGEENCSVMIVEAENTTPYLARTPLFAGFWQDHSARFCRVIIAVVDRRLKNEMLRQVQTITGGLEGRDDVMVAIQDLAYTAGGISA